MARTLWTDDAGLPVTWDQTRLPFEQVAIALHDAEACAHAIASMQVRGAPLIGAVGAWGLALALREAADDAALQSAFDRLAATRPTAVNLRWALARVRAAVLPLPVAARAARAHAEALRLCDEDVACNAAIGRHGQALLEPLRRDGRPLQLLTTDNQGVSAGETGTPVPLGFP